MASVPLSSSSSGLRQPTDSAVSDRIASAVRADSRPPPHSASDRFHASRRSGSRHVGNPLDRHPLAAGAADHARHEMVVCVVDAYPCDVLEGVSVLAQLDGLVDLRGAHEVPLGIEPVEECGRCVASAVDRSQAPYWAVRLA